MTLAIGAVLIILATSLLGLYFAEYHAEKVQQQSLQAYWNARAGVEHYCQNYQLPKTEVYELGPAGLCRVSRQAGGDVVFEGQSGTVTRKICLIAGDPGRAISLP